MLAQTGSTPNTRLFVGEEFDPDLGLINLRARLYNATTGRFLTLDSLTGDRLVPLSWNRYLYAHADPANLSDPLGKDVLAYGSLLAIVTAAAIVPIQGQIGFNGKTTTYTNGAVFVAGAVANCAFLYAADWTADLGMSLAGSPGDTPTYAPPFQYCNHTRDCRDKMREFCHEECEYLIGRDNPKPPRPQGPRGGKGRPGGGTNTQCQYLNCLDQCFDRMCGGPGGGGGGGGNCGGGSGPAPN